MNTKLTARIPLQERSRARVGLMLQAAETLLQDDGLSAFSIPVLAERLSYPRATIYKFFPTPYALLNTLAEQHISALEQLLLSQAGRIAREPDWRAGTRLMVKTAAGYYRDHPVACILLLSGPVSDDSYRALEYSINRLGKFTHDMLAQGGIALAEQPCEAALAIEFGTSCFRFSYFLQQTITPDYIEAAGDAMIAFIEKRQAARQPV